MRQTIDGDDVLIITGYLLSTDRQACFVEVSTLERTCFPKQYLHYGQTIFYIISISIYSMDQS